MQELELLQHTDTINELLARYGVKFGIYKNQEFKEATVSVRCHSQSDSVRRVRFSGAGSETAGYGVKSVSERYIR